MFRDYSSIFPIVHLISVEILPLLGPIAEEKPISTRVPVYFSLLQERTEGSYPSPGAYHYDVLCTILRENERSCRRHVNSYFRSIGLTSVCHEPRTKTCPIPFMVRVSHYGYGQMDCSFLEVGTAGYRIQSRLQTVHSFQ